ncbi:MAG: potassium transporter TrkG, partial [Pseudomonadota bacterium]
AFAPTSLIALIMCMLVGGCLGATAGGVKAFRIGFIAAAARLALLRARTPSSARTYLRVFGRKTEPEEGTDVIALLAVYALTTAALWLALALSGAAPLAGLFDVVSALSTVGLSVGAVTPDLPALTKALVTFGMMLGRLEFLALIVFLTPRTWIKG